jgi:hypothetical protein
MTLERSVNRPERLAGFKYPAKHKIAVHVLAKADCPLAP